MPQDVTYADLKFSQSPPEGTRLEDLAYENVQASSRLEQKGGTKQTAWFAALGCAGVALILLAALIGLGVHHWRLQKTSEEEKVQLAKQLREEEERMEAVQMQLSRARTELDRVKDTLTESQHQANVVLAALEMQRLSREEALNTSWAQAAKGKKKWEESKAACEAQSSRLLITRSWEPDWVQGLLGNSYHWIGLRSRKREKTRSWIWTWVDDSTYEGNKLPRSNGDSCALLTRAGELQQKYCTSPFPYICERAKGGWEQEG
nr:PREDICTED: C-type lectin domain family 12 member A isoform X2 [Anolis carolinensis]|eukprot:XP_008119901.1 PREDICTED: C-type lectin domain family 12 member A isoform X2 [Anolis carolinensis]